MNGRPEPVLTAGGITVVASAVMAAFWGVTSDLGILARITSPTQALVTAAVISVIALLAAVRARGQVTPLSSPKLELGTEVTTPSGVTAIVKANPKTD